MSDVRFERVLFYYAEWQDAYRELQFDDAHVAEEAWTERAVQRVKATKKKNVIEFHEGLPRAEDYSNAFPEIGNNRQSYERIVV